MDKWKFEDPENLAVISTRKIFGGGGWIAYASHDADDESWQFYGDEAEVDQGDLILVATIYGAASVPFSRSTSVGWG
ncbi:hypothetical protein FJ981_25570 [Mesorhizobium sp. B1-1-4]|uniref:hypothetical protein n=1 Tax=Mesorhizobium sp. B1-1-4 TaxID=2589980 RepID=UPI001127C836|nr:hypothetical protein [Mesorhizobium sp. B1-1-4]TPN46572.1 hypothetical protein FJ981_25570 [Mesorhizobium sp. B1-1-4]